MFYKIMNAANTFIRRKGWKIVDDNPNDHTCTNIVARDENHDLHIVQVGYKQGEDEYNVDTFPRERIEQAAISWLMENDNPDNPDNYSVHFDKLTFTVLNNGRAFVKAYFDYMS